MAISITEQNIQDLISWYNEHLYISAVLDSGVTPSKITIDADGDSLAKVRQLHLDERPIKSIEGVEKLSGVLMVDAKNCKFDVIPEWMVKLPAVQVISLTGNDLRLIQPSFWCQNLWLAKIYLDSNKYLQSIDNDYPSVSLGVHLWYLNVSECDLRSLPENLFSHRLKEVYISGNTGQYLDIVQNKQNVVNMFLN